MNMRYFIVFSVSFISVCAFSTASVAQGSNRVTAFSKNFVNRQVSNFSGSAAGEKFWGTVDSPREVVTRFVTVPRTPKKRRPRFFNRQNRPNLFHRGPMSFK